MGPASVHSPSTVVRILDERARSLGLSPPAVLDGNWFGVRSVVVPSVAIVDVPFRDFMTSYPSPGSAPSDVTVGGGLIGCLHYPESADSMPTARQGWCDEVLVLDNDGWWYESISQPRNLEDITACLGRAGSSTFESNWHIAWTAPDRGHHREAVARCLDAIGTGEIYQACVVTHFTGNATGRPVDVFCDVVDATRPARAAYMAGAWGQLASFSPELFLARRGRRVESRPIKGTAPRHHTPESLLDSVKDVAENVMIVDLVRNDLGVVAEVGSVRVSALLSVESAPAVWHLVSVVTASVDAALNNASVIDATFPPASVTGAPKRRARQLTRTWEERPRGVYCGAVGMASPAAGMELNVAIRTIEFSNDGSCLLGVGGGITADSDPDREWDECVLKASSIVGARSSKAAGPLATRWVPTGRSRPPSASRCR